MTTLERLESSLWQEAPNYCGKTWEGYYVLYGQRRDSDALGRSNFESFKLALDPWKDSVVVVREGHWLCGWVEWLGLTPDAPQEAKEAAEKILSALADYPVIDDEHLSKTQEEEADDVWKNCYTWQDRIKYIRKNGSQFDFRNCQDLLRCVRGEYFAGYASELL